jgi:hypothetical protein
MPTLTLATLLAAWSGQRITASVVLPDGAPVVATVPALPDQAQLPEDRFPELWGAWREVRDERVAEVLTLARPN